MISFAGLPDSYWGEAVVTAAYIRNGVPTRTFKQTMSVTIREMVKQET